MSSSIEILQTENTVKIILNRPKSYNAVTSKMFLELQKAINDANNDNAISLIILTGKGDKAFSTGVDLNEDFLSTGKETSKSLMKYAVPLISLIVNSSKPIIAAVNGLCVGIGTSLALACDIIIMAEDTSLDLTFSELGLIPDGGANWLLVKKLGYNKAYQLVIRSSKIKALDAKTIGLVSNIFPKDNFIQSIDQYANRLAKTSLLSMTNTKIVMKNAMCGEDFVTSMERESNLQGECIDSEFFQNKIRQFKKL